MKRWIEKSSFRTEPENPAIIIRNRNLRNSNPLPPISNMRHRDADAKNKMEEVNQNSALSMQIHVPSGDRKWANKYHKPCILPPIRQSFENSVCDTKNDTHKKVALVTEKIQHLNHMHACVDLHEKTCVSPGINIRQVIPNLEALNFDFDLKFPENSSAVSTEDEPIVERSLEIVRSEEISKFLESSSSNRRNAICTILDQEIKNGLTEYYRRLSIKALISVFPDMSIALENLEAKSSDFTSF